MRLFWRCLKWTLLVVLAAVLAFAGLNAFDEELRPEAKAALESPGDTVPARDNLFHALLGFHSPSDDLVQAGLALRGRMERLPPWDTAKTVQDRVQREAAGELPGGLRLQGNVRDLGASLGEALAALRAGRVDARQMLATNRELLARYRSLRGYRQFANPMAPRTDTAAVPPYASVGQVRRVWLLSVADMVGRGDMGAAVRELCDDTQAWRGVLAQPQLEMIDKMVLAGWVRDGLRSASQLLQEDGLTAEHRRLLAQLAGPLTAAERSLAGPLAAEFRLLALSVRDDVRKRRAQGPTPLLYLHQSNATTNGFHAAAQRLIEADAHDCRAFESDTHALVQAARPPWWRYAYNPMGKVLIYVAGKDASPRRYSARMCDLLGFQRLLALQLRLHDQGITSRTPQPQIEAAIAQAGAAYADPFTGGPMMWSPQRRGIAFGAVDDRNRKMLPWPL